MAKELERIREELEKQKRLDQKPLTSRKEKGFLRGREMERKRECGR